MPPKRKQARKPQAKVDQDSSASAGEETVPVVAAKKPKKAEAPKKPQSDDNDGSDPGVIEEQKTVAKSTTTGSKSAHRADVDIDGGATWTLDKNRSVSISEFKGRTYVNIREYYEKGGKFLPTKKGISLSLEQWAVLGECVADINTVLATKK